MNFITSLPKQKPRVKYLVATGKLGGACYRMHIVACDASLPILCHMLRIQNHLKIGIGIPSRQHFKETCGGSKGDAKEISVRESLGCEDELSDRKMHPLELEALLFKVAPFRNPLKEINCNVN